ncbi:MAG: cytochrome b/b6 domain-containing protein [Mariprofundaceae bacterium]
MTCWRAVPVWNGIVRITHWLNAAFVPLLLALGLLLWLRKALGLPESTVGLLTDIHATIGFAFAASLFTRLALMLARPEGPSHWRDILPAGPERRRELLATLRFYLGGLRGEPPLYFAHNALAGLAYAGFFALGVCQVGTGAAMYLPAGEVAGGALSGPPKWLVALHLAGAGLVLLFVIAHLAMLALHELIETRGLASGMISGRKFFTDEELSRLGRNPSAKEEHHEQT